MNCLDHDDGANYTNYTKNSNRYDSAKLHNLPPLFGLWGQRDHKERADSNNSAGNNDAFRTYSKLIFRAKMKALRA